MPVGVSKSMRLTESICSGALTNSVSSRGEGWKACALVSCWPGSNSTSPSEGSVDFFLNYMACSSDEGGSQGSLLGLGVVSTADGSSRS